MAKFISIRLQPGKKTRVYVNKVDPNNPKIHELGKFTVESPGVAGAPAGAQVLVSPHRWPGTYQSPVALSLGSQWSESPATIEPGDLTGNPQFRALESVDFTYDEARKKLSWKQQTAQGLTTGSVNFTKEVPVWYVTLTPVKQSQGLLKAKGAVLEKIL